MSAQYTLAQSGDPAAERQRLSLLERCYDAWTVAELEQAGVTAGWTCIDAGAGGGSIAKWLAERAGVSGSTVLAIDLDLRLLESALGNVPAISTSDGSTFATRIFQGGADLVHARFLLEHLPEFRIAFDRMVRALRPGGWLVVTDADFTSVRLDVADPAFDRASSAFAAATRSAELGSGVRRVAPVVALFSEDAGLAGIVATSRQVRERGGDHGALLAASYGRIATLMERHGARSGDVERAQALMQHPATLFTGPTIWTVRGRVL